MERDIKLTDSTGGRLTCIVIRSDTGIRVADFDNFVLVGIKGREMTTIVNADVVDLQEAVEDLQAIYRGAMDRVSDQVRNRVYTAQEKRLQSQGGLPNF